MAKYRKKPVVIEAEQWFEGQDPETYPEYLTYVPQRGYVIQTLEGDMVVSNGDFIITGIKGERYPCKPDIFHATYEAVQG